MAENKKKVTKNRWVKYKATINMTNSNQTM